MGPGTSTRKVSKACLGCRGKGRLRGNARGGAQRWVGVAAAAAAADFHNSGASDRLLRAKSITLEPGEEDLIIPESFVYTSSLAHLGLFSQQTSSSLADLPNHIVFSFERKEKYGRGVSLLYLCSAPLEVAGMELRVKRGDVENLWSALERNAERIPETFSYAAELAPFFTLTGMSRDDTMRYRGGVLDGVEFTLETFVDEEEGDEGDGEGGRRGCGYRYRTDAIEHIRLLVPRENMDDFVLEVGEKDTCIVGDEEHCDLPSIFTLTEEIRHLFEAVQETEDGNVIEYGSSEGRMMLELVPGGAEFHMTRTLVEDDGSLSFIFGQSGVKGDISLKLSRHRVEDLQTGLRGAQASSLNDPSEDELSDVVSHALGILSRRESVNREVEVLEEEMYEDENVPGNTRDWTMGGKAGDLPVDSNLGVHDDAGTSATVEQITGTYPTSYPTTSGDSLIPDTDLGKKAKPKFGPELPPAFHSAEHVVPLKPGGPVPFPEEHFACDGTFLDGKDFNLLELDDTNFVIRSTEDGAMVLNDIYVFNKETAVYSRPRGIEQLPSAPRKYQHVYCFNLVPFTMGKIKEELYKEEVSEPVFEVEKAFMVPIESESPYRLNLEEAYVLDGITGSVEEATIHGDGVKNPVLVLRGGELHLEDAKDLKTPLELHKEHKLAQEDERNAALFRKKYMFANLGDEGDDAATDGADIPFEEVDDEIENLYKDVEDGPDVPEVDLE